MKRRKFVANSAKVGLAITAFGGYACKQAKKEVEKEVVEIEEEETKTPFFELSLAQWSMHKMIGNEGVDPYSFAEKAKAWGFTGLEYVSGLYYKELEKDNFSEAAMKAFIDKSNAEAEKHGMKNLLIMIDGQGDLATPDADKRKEAVENHHKWVDAAAAMGCHAIRVNLSGSDNAEEWTSASIDGLTQLSTYAKPKNINITVENHGGFSSNGAMLANVMKEVNMDNCGTLPDFGNFCMKWGKWPECDDWYDRYKGMEELMPYAKAVSAKSHDFDADGNEIHSDYVKMLKIVKEAGYTGYIGVEYEGSAISEEEGIIATRDLLIKAGKQV
ncbi:MAG: sugar phosphate isomerase/epimerase family protein [Allomuricauda sp.]